MILTITLVLISVGSLLVLLYAARGQSAPFRKLDDMVHELRPVDLAAFRNLMDPEEEKFLQGNLSPADFRVLQGERLRGVALQLHSLSPLLTIARGYSIVRRDADQSIVTSVQQASSGDQLTIQVRA